MCNNKISIRYKYNRCETIAAGEKNIHDTYFKNVCLT